MRDEEDITGEESMLGEVDWSPSSSFCNRVRPHAASPNPNPRLQVRASLTPHWETRRLPHHAATATAQAQLLRGEGCQ
jgi:hypothetical protein